MDPPHRVSFGVFEDFVGPVGGVTGGGEDHHARLAGFCDRGGDRVPEAVRDELTRRGHDLEIAGDWTEGYLLAAERNPDSGVLEAGCDPRGGKSEVFPAFALCW